MVLNISDRVYVDLSQDNIDTESKELGDSQFLPYVISRSDVRETDCH